MQLKKKSFDWKEEREGEGFGRAYIHNNKELGKLQDQHRKNHAAPDHNIRQDKTVTEFAPGQIREINDAS